MKKEKFLNIYMKYKKTMKNMIKGYLPNFY